MAEFTPINTQEDFNKAIGPRLEEARKRAEDAVRKEYADYDALKTGNAELRKQLDEANAALEEAQKKAGETDAAHKAHVAELESKVKSMEGDALKAAKALEYGLPYDLHSRLRGDSAEEIEADAKTLAQILRSQAHEAPPSKSYEPSNGYGSGKEAALRGLAQKLTEQKGG